MRPAIVLLVTLSWSLPAAGATWLVPSQIPTIADALGAASPGDTVEVACGTYAEHDLVLKSGVVLRGGTGDPACVVVDAGSAGRIALGMRVTGASIEGITFRGGFEASGADHGRDAAPDERAQALAPPDHDYGGGGAFFLLGPDLTIRACRFVANEAVVHGGALRIQGGTVRLVDVVFEDNVAGNQGGAFHAAGGALVRLDGVVAHGNRARHGGAGYASFSQIEASGCDFRGNVAGGGGGALQLSRTGAMFDGCTFLENTGRRGGAIAMYTVPGTGLTVTGSTFARNAAPTGAAIAGPANLQRTILAFHRDGPVADCGLGDLQLSCCDVFGNAGGDFVGCLADESGVDGNFSADPEFCALGDGNVGLHLGSPCAAASSPCGLLVGAEDVGCEGLDITTVTTVPPGLEVVVDDVPYTAPVGFQWVAGTTHVLAAPTPQAIGPDSRWAFAGWSDGGAATHEILAPAGDSEFAATFAAEHRLVMIVDGSGTVTPGTGWQPEGATVDIQAVATPPGVFARWVGDGAGSYTGTSPVAQITMPGPVTETAYFSPDGDFQLTMTFEGSGTVEPGTGRHAVGETVEIRATPAAGWDFVRWTGSGSGSYTGPDAVAQVSMYDDLAQHAEFTQRMHPVTITATGAGTVTPPSGMYAEGSVLTIRATPSPGYSFAEWIGEGPGSYSGPQAVASITVLGPITENAIFTGPPTHPLTMGAGPGGQVAPPSGDYPTGSYVTIEAVPGPGFAFRRWLGAGPGSYSGSSARAVVQMLGPITQTAEFRTLQYRTLTMTADPGGSVTPPTGTYLEGSVVTITAIADSAHLFMGWQGTGLGSYSGTLNPATVLLTTENVTQHARFASAAVSVTVTTEPAGLPIVVDGAEYTSPGVFSWLLGTQHHLQVDPAHDIAAGERHAFTAWADGVTSLARVVTAAPLGYHSATYRHEYLLTQPPDPGGTTRPGTAWIGAGTTFDIEAVPSLNHAFEGWSGEGPGAYTGPDTRATVVMDGPITETATFAPLGFEFSLSASDTDPWANLVPATNGPRDVHLWLTCAEFGISAMEATLASSGNLQIFGFQPVGNVLNAGGATNLLLAVGGCPAGAELPIRLGRWTVMDDGGSLCLGTGAPGGYAAVECDPLYPGVAENPVVVGFSSNGSAPCTAGEHGCGTGGGGAARMAALRAGWNAAAPVVTENALVLAPNPFRGAAEITLSLKQDAHVRLDVYDVAGRLVRRVTDEPLPAGVLTRRWDSRDASGRMVPSGIYFVRLDTSSGFHAVRKIVFLGAR